MWRHIFLFLVGGAALAGGAIMGGEMLGVDVVHGITSSLSKSCVDWGICRSYKQQLIDIYMVNNPKKVEGVPRLMQKWEGIEDLLIAEVRQKYAGHDDSAGKALMKMDTWTDVLMLGARCVGAFLPLILLLACFLGMHEGSEKEKKKREKKHDFKTGC